MPNFTRLSPEQATAWERWQRLHQANARDEVRLAKAQARARLAQHLSEKLAGSPLRQSTRADMLRRQADAIALQQRLQGALRFGRFRLMRTIELWMGPA